MWIKEIVIILFGLAGGCVVAGGVFTVFTAVGLIPRFAEQTGSADHILLYENMLILGTLAGLITTVYYDTSVRAFALAANSRIALLQTAALCQQACAEHEACPQDCRYRRW